MKLWSIQMFIKVNVMLWLDGILGGCKVAELLLVVIGFYKILKLLPYHIWSSLHLLLHINVPSLVGKQPLRVSFFIVLRFEVA